MAVETEAQASVVATVIASGCDATRQQQISTSTKDEQPEIRLDEGEKEIFEQDQHQSVLPLVVADQCPARVSPPSLPADEIDSEWLDRHYPPLDYPLLDPGEEEPFIGISAVEFFGIFLDDEAPYNFVEFQKKRGDVDICYGAWDDLLSPDWALQLDGERLSMHPSATTTIKDLATDSIHSLRQRIIRFKAKTNSLFGPPFASTTKTQRILIGSKRWAILESKTLLGDIPFSDRFMVIERWLIQADKHAQQQVDHSNAGAGVYTCSVTSSCAILFSTQCPFEQQIRSKSCIALKVSCGTTYGDDETFVVLTRYLLLSAGRWRRVVGDGAASAEAGREEPHIATAVVAEATERAQRRPGRTLNR